MRKFWKERSFTTTASTPPSSPEDPYPPSVSGSFSSTLSSPAEWPVGTGPDHNALPWSFHPGPLDSGPAGLLIDDTRLRFQYPLNLDSPSGDPSLWSEDSKFPNSEPNSHGKSEGENCLQAGRPSASLSDSLGPVDSCRSKSDTPGTGAPSPSLYPSSNFLPNLEYLSNSLILSAMSDNSVIELGPGGMGAERMEHPYVNLPQVVDSSQESEAVTTSDSEASILGRNRRRKKEETYANWARPPSPSHPPQPLIHHFTSIPDLIRAESNISASNKISPAEKVHSSAGGKNHYPTELSDNFSSTNHCHSPNDDESAADTENETVKSFRSWFPGKIDRSQKQTFKRVPQPKAVERKAKAVTFEADKASSEESSDRIYESKDEVVISALLACDLYSTLPPFPTPSTSVSRDESTLTDCGLMPKNRNKLNLRIDTDSTPPPSRTDASATPSRDRYKSSPFYDYFVNSPVLKKIRELESPLPWDEVGRRKQLTIAISLLAFIVIILVLLHAVPSIMKAAKDDRRVFVSSPASHYRSLRPYYVSGSSRFPASEFRLDRRKNRYRVKLITAAPLGNGRNSVPNAEIPDQDLTLRINVFGSPTTESSDELGESQFEAATTPEVYAISSSSHSTLRNLESTTPWTPAVSTWLPTYDPNFICKEDQFKCESGVSRVPCLYLWERCNGIRDCSDGSDEKNCDKLECYGNFKCADGDEFQCVSLSNVCNGIPDCENGSDEMGCDSFECKPYEFQCPSGYCIPKEWLCDSDSDCYGHEDEFNCSTSCESNEFLCAEGWCISENWRCNGVRDCAGGEDEVGCGCSGGEGACRVGGCVPHSRFCDGISDCSDGSDEWDCLRNAEVVQLKNSAGIWLPVCADNFTQEMSHIVCQQIGMSSPASFGAIRTRGQNSEVIGLSEQARLLGDPLRLQSFAIPSSSGSSSCRSGLVSVSCHHFSCGRWHPSSGRSRQKRLVGGHVSSVNQWPSMALLFHPHKKWACTASIISPNYLLTSALCIRRTNESPFAWKVFAGSGAPKPGDPDMVERRIQSFVFHPSYKFRTLIADYDVALVRLETPLELTAVPRKLYEEGNKIGAICLPNADTEPGAWCMTAGWGYTTPGGYFVNEQLRHLEMVVVGRGECNSSNHYSGLLSHRMLCALNNQSDAQPCSNDEGAPLMCLSRSSGRWYLAGVMTTHSCGSRKHPAVYADIVSLKEWIEKTTGLG